MTRAASALVALQAARELSDMFARKGWQPFILLSMALCLAFLLAAIWANARLLLLAVSISMTVIGSFIWLLVTRSPSDRIIVERALTLAIPFYVGRPLAFLQMLRGNSIGITARGFW